MHVVSPEYGGVSQLKFMSLASFSSKQSPCSFPRQLLSDARTGFFLSAPADFSARYVLPVRQFGTYVRSREAGLQSRLFHGSRGVFRTLSPLGRRRLLG